MAISKVGTAHTKKRKWLLAIAISIDILALAYYKYASFFAKEVANAFGLHWTIDNVALPLGISFFTFTQIAFLVDTYQGKVKEPSFSRYLLFVTYFPHLIAGPVIHHRDVMSQFAKNASTVFHRTNFTVGLAIFIIGLFKKVVIADTIAGYVAPVFTAAESGSMLGAIESWTGALSYTFQLYFDFSGYSDMAIGLSMMLNIRLPFNFNSPYKSKSIIEFWTRWHISLSTFLRDYLYIPLGGNRRGEFRRYMNLLVTMLIGGLWHGAGWTFIVWGALHGFYLVVNHAWRQLMHASHLGHFKTIRVLSVPLTFTAVVIGWVFFRAESLNGACQIIAGMAGRYGSGSWHLATATGAPINLMTAVPCIAILTGIVFFFPNSQQLACRILVQEGFLVSSHSEEKNGGWRSPHIAWAFILGLILTIAMIHISEPTQFLYFNF